MPPEQRAEKMQSLQSWLRLVRGYRAVWLLLILVIITMLAMWRPWEPTIPAGSRTISVTGTATVTATPDQYVFSPSYNFTNAVKQAALDQLTAKSNELIAKLKSLGVEDSEIKTNASGSYNYGYYM